MFSKRLDWPFPENRLSALLKRRRGRGAPIFDLTESNPTRVDLPYPRRGLAEALADPEVAGYQPAPCGLATARQAVADLYARSGHQVPADRIVLTASTSEAYALLFKILADPGERVLVPRPSYPLFDYLAALESLPVAPYPLVYDGRWGIDRAALEETVGADGARPAAVVAVSPNNPTGSTLSRDDTIAIDDLCARHGSALIADEVFIDYPFPGATAAAAASATGACGGEAPLSTLASPAGALTFTLGGLSKSCGLPQMKLGWIVVRGPEGLVAGALERLEIVCDTYLSVGTPVQRALPRLLALGEGIRAAIRSRLLENRAALVAAAGGGSPCRVLHADGGWSAVLQVPAVTTEEEIALRLLDEDGVLVHPGYFFDFPREAYLIVSLLPRPDRFREGVSRLLSRLSAG